MGEVTDAKGYEGGSAFIALSKYKASSSKKSKGSIFVNPGGPGGSGYRSFSAISFTLISRSLMTSLPPPVEFTFRVGPSLSLIIQDSYDIIGFDPRGIGLTVPAMRCFPTLREETLFLASLGPGPEIEGDREAYERDVRRGVEQSRGVAERCEEWAGDAARHVSRCLFLESGRSADAGRL